MRHLGRRALLALAVSWGAVNSVAVPQNDDSSHLFFRAAATIGTVIDRSSWKVTCDSVHQGDECAKGIDGDKNTFWHTQWSQTDNPKPPHKITVDMGSIKNVNGLSMLPRQDGSPNGFIGRHEVRLSTDGSTWSSPVAFGTWYADNTQKVASFETKRARYVQLIALSEANNNPWTSIAELNIFQADSYTDPAPGIGQWGPTIDFPLVPAAAAVEPKSGRILVFSAWHYDSFGGSPGGYTLSSMWDPATGEVSQRTVSQTNHDMFCPGISMDGNGQIVVTGGNNAPKTSLYDSVSDTWTKGPDMKIPRGYQSSATLPDGRVFTIGGSWSGGSFEKNGEVYDPKAKSWKLLPKALTRPMLTNDPQGIYRSDNHAWLFGWKSGTVFQAGPSTAMNWYYTTGDGNTKSAGRRASDRGVAPDQMCGNSVMYDAVKGKILTFGGSPAYQDSDATAQAHIITLGDPGTQPGVVFASNGLWYPRAFHTSVVLPDGTVFITGGQSHAVPFSDDTAQLTPELYNPETDTFYKQQPNSIVRVYHSVAILLPDATVFNGGGGLCGNCDTNHFDAQIFTPAYLFDSNGKRATRPKISSVSQTTLKAGNTLTVTADSSLKSASLIRYGTSTHTVNTDQRRIPLTLKSLGGNKYSFVTPNDSGIILPGYWMLFVMNSAGVPSIATTVQVLVS